MASTKDKAPHTTIEETSKELKLHMLCAYLCMGAGAGWLFASGADSPSAAALALMVTGLIWHIVTHIRVWWHHR